MALKVGICSWSPGWRGLLSIFLLVTTLTSRYCAESYSNYINIDDDDDSSTATTFASAFDINYNAILSSTIPSADSSIKFSSISPPQLPQPSNEEEDVTSTTDFSITPSLSSSSSSSLPPFLEHQQHNSISSSEANEIPYQYNFAHPIYNVTIPENSVQKTFAIQPYTDKDRMGIQLFDTIDGTKSSYHVDVKYQIVGGDKNKIFKAEERIVGDFAFLTIRTRTNNIVLNREKGDSYRLRIKATITRSSKTGTKKRTIQEAETFVDVKVLDKNDLSPLFYPTKYSITITDDTPLHQSILRVTAEDADVGINGGEIL